jgi:hydrogenase maturation protease
MQDRILIMGIGNYLMGDEGIGVHLAQAITQQALPDNVDVLDGGTGGFFLMEYFENYPQVILVDATMDNRPTGTIRLIEPRFAKDFPRAMSTHDIGLRDLVEGLAILGKLPKIHLFVISIAEIQSQQIELSPEIAAVIPTLERRILNLVDELNEEVLV